MPDFLIKSDNGDTLVLATKGQQTRRNIGERKTLVEWILAVNHYGKFGTWICDVSFDAGDADGIIEKYANNKQSEEKRMNTFQQSPLYNRLTMVDWCKNCPLKMHSTCNYPVRSTPRYIKDYFLQMSEGINYNAAKNIYYAPYENMKSNFVIFWNKQYGDNKKHEKELEEIFDEAVDKVAEMNEDEFPELSFILYGYGYLRADNLIKAVEKVRKLIEVGNILKNKYGGCTVKC